MKRLKLHVIFPPFHEILRWIRVRSPGPKRHSQDPFGKQWVQQVFAEVRFRQASHIGGDVQCHAGCLRSLLVAEPAGAAEAFAWHAMALDGSDSEISHRRSCSWVKIDGFWFHHPLVAL